MKPLCFVGVVDDGYQEYLPLFAYFALRAYPDSELILYHVDPLLRAEVRACLDSLADLGGIDVRRLDYRYDTGDPQSLKSLRWVLYDDDFAGYDNVYVGDVDLLIVREEPGLREVRIEHSKEIERPYSNRVRTGTRLVAGISHFIRSEAYFPRVLPRMLHDRAEIAAGRLRLHNEELLYRLLENTVGLPARRVPLNTHHGIHLRAFHRARSIEKQRARTDYLFDKVFARYCDGFLALARSERCREIVDRLSRIDSSPQRLERYPSAGPGLARQFRNVLALCDALIEERESSEGRGG
jgi:hypothetical protein